MIELTLPVMPTLVKTHVEILNTFK